MKKEREVQEVNRRQNQMVKTSFDAQKREAMKLQAEAVLKKQQQQHAPKNKDEIVKKQQEPPAPLDSTAKVPPPRPRQRPQGSPTKESLGMNFDSSKFQSSKPAAPDASTKPFVADFGANFTADLNAALGSKNAAKDVKKPPPRPSVPSANKDDSMERKKKEQEEAEQRRKVNLIMIKTIHHMQHIRLCFGTNLGWEINFCVDWTYFREWHFWLVSRGHI